MCLELRAVISCISGIAAVIQVSFFAVRSFRTKEVCNY